MLERRSNILHEKALAFAQRILRMETYLKKQTKCNSTVINQVIRSGTSVSANIAESLNAESKLDFIHKLGLALKEADETKDWLVNIKASYTVHQIAFQTIIEDIDEIRYILIASIKTAKGINNKE